MECQKEKVENKPTLNHIKKNKRQKINLTKRVKTPNENHNILMKEIGDGTKKWKDISRRTIRKRLFV